MGSAIVAVMGMDRTKMIQWGGVIIAAACAMCAAGCTDYADTGEVTDGVPFPPGYSNMTIEEASTFVLKASTLVVDVSPVWHRAYTRCGEHAAGNSGRGTHLSWQGQGISHILSQ